MSLSFPKFPSAKTYIDQMTPEQEVLMKLVAGQQITNGDEVILLEAIEFYKKTYSHLRSIDLSHLTDEEATDLKVFLRQAINMAIWPKNKINFYNVFRVTFVSDSFLESGKVRNTDFISYPPLKIINEQGIYGRANTPQSTIFYCAFHPEVAFLETKPEAGTRVILAQWYNDHMKTFLSVPITNNKTIDNDSLRAATKAFNDIKNANHPLFAEILDLYFDFLSGEFVKDGPVVHAKKYEYFFSGFYSDIILDGQKDVDCIIYPSVAHKHKSENLAIAPLSLNKLRPFKLQDCIVEKTMYQEFDGINIKEPVQLKILRESMQFDGNRIIWNDD